jgi:hypothetical protein
MTDAKQQPFAVLFVVFEAKLGRETKYGANEWREGVSSPSFGPARPDLAVPDDPPSPKRHIFRSQTAIFSALMALRAIRLRARPQYRRRCIMAILNDHIDVRMLRNRDWAARVLER